MKALELDNSLHGIPTPSGSRVQVAPSRSAAEAPTPTTTCTDRMLTGRSVYQTSCDRKWCWLLNLGRHFTETPWRSVYKLGHWSPSLQWTPFYFYFFFPHKASRRKMRTRFRGRDWAPICRRIDNCKGWQKWNKANHVLRKPGCNSWSQDSLGRTRWGCLGKSPKSWDLITPLHMSLSVTLHMVANAITNTSVFVLI